VENPGELDKALREAFESDKPSLIDIIVDPDKMIYPTKRAE
jgi:pyruvate oxidase